MVLQMQKMLRLYRFCRAFADGQVFFIEKTMKKRWHSARDVTITIEFYKDHFSRRFQSVPNDRGEQRIIVRRMSYKASSEIPIIALTANSYQEDIRKCLDAGMNTHLSKPIEIKKSLQQYFWKRILIWNGFIFCLQKTMSSQIGSFLMGHIGVFTVFSVF